MENLISLSLLNIKEHRVHASDNAITHMVSSSSCKLVGTCNGLLFFTSSDQGESIYVCNPITRELVTLPKPTRTAPPESSMLMYGFGLDYLKKKYKVVRVFYPTNSRFRNPRFHVTAKVYTLGAASSWKAVGFNRPPYGRPVFTKDGFNSHECKPKCQTRLKISGFPTWLDWEVCSSYRGSLVPLGAFCDNKDGENDAAYFVSDIKFYSRPVCSGF